jgi:lysosomal alpha-mannosidase
MVIRIPVALPSGVGSWIVTASDGKTSVTAQLIPASRRDLFLREKYYGAPAVSGLQWLAFIAPEAVPAQGFAVFFLEPAPSAVPSTHVSAVQRMSVGTAAATDQQLTNGILTLTISAATGMMSAWSSVATGISLPLTQEFLWYNASSGNGANDGSGANSYGQSSTTYIFRPNSSTPFPVTSGPAEVELLTGPVLSEARQYMGGGDWACNVLRLYALSSAAVESEWTIGPIPDSDGLGKEVCLGYINIKPPESALKR